MKSMISKHLWIFTKICLFCFSQGPIGLDGPKGEPVSYRNQLQPKYSYVRFQGRPGDKGQKGQPGSAGLDVLQAVKVSKFS